MSLVQFRDEAPYFGLLKRLISISKESENLSPSGSPLNIRDEESCLILLKGLVSISKESENLSVQMHTVSCADLAQSVEQLTCNQ